MQLKRLVMIMLLMVSGFGAFFYFNYGTVQTPYFSVKSGFYDRPFELTLSAGINDTIYYTLDGTIPNETSKVYEDAIWVSPENTEGLIYTNIGNISSYGDYFPQRRWDKAILIKAISVNRRGEVSEVASREYYVGEEIRKDSENLYVMSISMNPDDLFSDKTGIYVLGDTYKEAVEQGIVADYEAVFPANYRNKGKDWEREADIYLFDEDRNLLVEQTMGIRIHGGWSRAFRQKGFNLYSGSSYGDVRNNLDEYMLRTSGFRDTFQTMLRDVFNQSLVMDRNIALQKSKPCILYLNGEYWGLYNLQQRFTKTYFLDECGIPSTDIICLKKSGANTSYIGTESDLELYNDLETYIEEHDMTVLENYYKLSEMMDIQNYIDYLAFECYIANMDWPINNYCCFRSRKISNESDYCDGKWRWGAYDTDDSTNIITGDGELSTPMSNPFLDSGHLTGNPMTLTLTSGLMQNVEFRQQFVLSFMDMANVNFDYAKVHKELYSIAELYEAAVVYTQNRFNSEEYTSENFWNYIGNIDEFYKKRKNYVVDYLAEAFELDGTLAQVTLSVNDVLGGDIQINTTIPDLTGGTWSGDYFTDYPITITAIPKEGYRFVGWEGGMYLETSTVVLPLTEQGVSVRAVFEKAKS